MDTTTDATAIVERGAEIVNRVTTHVATALLQTTRTPRWRALLESLEQLGLALDVAKLLSREPSPPDPELAVDPAEFGDHLAGLFRRLLMGELEPELATGTHATFGLRGDSVRLLDFEGNQELADLFDAIRLKVTVLLVAEDKLDLLVTLGEVAANPMVVQLRPQSLAVDVDLAALKSTLMGLATALRAAYPDVWWRPEELPELRGQLRLSVLAEEASAFTVALEVASKVMVRSTLVDRTVALELSPSPRTLMLEVDGARGSMALGLDLGKLSVDVPSRLLDPEAADLGDLQLDLAGLSAQIRFAQGDTQLRIESVGLGDAAATLTRNERVALRAELNPQTGRRVSLHLAPNPSAASLTVRVEPGLDAKLSCDLKALGETFAEGPFAWLADDTVRIRLEGNHPAIVPLNERGTRKAGIKIASGELHIDSLHSDRHIFVPQGRTLEWGTRKPAKPTPAR